MSKSPLTPSDEQERILGHDPSRHARVVAGPGTGKSLTSVWMVERFQTKAEELRVRMVTFTRAATQELAKKLAGTDLKVSEPSTIHSYALGLLMHHQALADIPTPLRIPDSIETKFIHSHIAERLRTFMSFEDIRADQIKDLEREMASQWASLDESVETAADNNPRLQAAYVGLWKEHRKVFGYTLLSEMPFQAWLLLRDHEPPLVTPDVLVVDEYQDLNRVDIALVKELAERGTSVIAIGDPYQSIYSFRLAAPDGIREFPVAFEGACDYQLSRCFRSGEQIVGASSALIDTATDRRDGVRLKPNPKRSDRFYYARFKGEVSEARGVAEMIAARCEQGVPARKIIVLVRGKPERFRKILEPELAERGIRLVEVDWVDQVLAQDSLRKKLCYLRIAVDREDSLAWWVLLDRHNGIAADFWQYVYEAARGKATFGETLMDLHPNFPEAPSGTSVSEARRLVRETLFRADRLHTKIEEADLGQYGWGGWILDHFGRDEFTPEAIELLESVGEALSATEELNRFLGQLTPIAEDLAGQTDAVRLMSMTKSKGLTVDSAFVMGVEDGLVPHPKGEIEEEKRLLFVAMTRAERLCVLTFAKWRRGQTGHQGEGRTDQSRGRSPLLSALPQFDWTPGDDVVAEVTAGVALPTEDE